MLLARLHWLMFAAYLFVFCAMPFTLLWGMVGLAVGALIGTSLLISLRMRAESRIAERLGMRRLSPAEAPHVHAIVNELSRRLSIPAPKLGIIDSSSLNIAAFGFRRDYFFLALTQGLISGLGRKELTALIGRQLCHLRSGHVPGESWLSQFLALFDWLSKIRVRGVAGSRRVYRFPAFLRQVLFYPATLYPALVLSGHRNSETLDMRSLRITRSPRALAEGLRLVEAMAERAPQQAVFSTRHLFLYSPPAPDPLSRVFFGEESFAKRIDAVEELTQVVALT